MILAIIGIIVLFLTFLRFAVAFVNLASRPYLPERVDEETSLPSLSVLIPVRNEEKNVGHLLQSLLPQEYPGAEFIIYDDGSTDGSASVIREFARKDERVRYTGSKGEPPAGWTGKNHACHILASEAKGDYLLFIDADVIAGADLLRRSVSYAARLGVTLLSIFPRQEMQSTGEKIVVPFMHRMLLSLLPLVLVRRCSWSSFSAANGQMMLFRADDYRKHLFHEKMKNRLAEDIEIMRHVKKSGMKGVTLTGRDEISCRMYDDYSSAVRGFSKNILSMFGNSWLFLFFYAFIGLFGWIPLLLLPWYFIASYLIMIILMNVMIAATSRQRFLDNLLLLIPGIFAFYHILFMAVRAHASGRHEWKGRQLANVR